MNSYRESMLTNNPSCMLDVYLVFNKINCRFEIDLRGFLCHLDGSNVNNESLMCDRRVVCRIRWAFISQPCENLICRGHSINNAFAFRLDESSSQQHPYQFTRSTIIRVRFGKGSKPFNLASIRSYILNLAYSE